MAGKIKSVYQMIGHLLIIALTVLTVIWVLFNIYFPWTTNHGESITVPELKGILIEEMDDYLEDRDLRYEVELDSGYDKNLPAHSVLKQFPLPNSKVKEKRKIYLTLNAKNAPKIEMPNLIGKSLKNAKLELKSRELLLGDISYKPNYADNTILAQYYNGEIISSRNMISKGSKIDLDVADGLGEKSFQMINLKGLDMEEAVFVLKGYGLNIGGVYREYNEYIDSTRSGKIVKHHPAANEKVQSGQPIDIWIIEQDTVSTVSN